MGQPKPGQDPSHLDRLTSLLRLFGNPRNRRIWLSLTQIAGVSPPKQMSFSKNKILYFNCLTPLRYLGQGSIGYFRNLKVPQVVVQTVVGNGRGFYLDKTLPT